MLPSELEPSELIRLSQLAEEVGYDEIWYFDQRFWRDCYIGLTQIAEHTERIRIGPGVNDPYTRHPAMIAMAIATLDIISGGRAQLGLGVGGSGIAEMQLPKDRPVRALREAIEIIRLMHSGQRVSYAGELFKLQDAILQVPPVQDHIPISIATHGPQVLALAGKKADGVMLGNMGTRDAIETATAVVTQASQEAGVPKGTVTISLRLEAVITEHSDEAMSVLRTRMARRLVSSYPKWTFLGAHKDQLHPAIAAAAAQRDHQRVTALLTDGDVRAQALVGSPGDVADQLCELLTNTIDRITIRPFGAGGQGPDATIRAFAEEVWPEVIRRRTRE